MIIWNSLKFETDCPKIEVAAHGDSKKGTVSDTWSFLDDNLTDLCQTLQIHYMDEDQIPNLKQRSKVTVKGGVTYIRCLTL